MAYGYDRPLYLLPFDHRGALEESLFGWKGLLTLAQSTVIEYSKRIIYDGFKTAVTAGVSKETAGLVVDEQFGADILRDAAAKGFTFACPVEKSGQEEFDFEYGDDFPSHIEGFGPAFCKALVRYNPEGEKALNQRQAGRLKRLSDYLHSESQSLFMCELIVPAENGQLDKVKGDEKAYDAEIRPGLAAQAIEQLQDAEIEPDVWNIDGSDRREDCERIVAAARRGGRDRVGCIVVGRADDDQKVGEWLKIAAGVPGFIGFAVAPSGFRKPIARWRTHSTAREGAVQEIALRYREFVDIFEKARAAN